MSSKAPKAKITKSSTCLCGDVSLTVTGVDKGAVLCHCSNCQRWTGSAFAHNYRFMEAEVDIKQGKDVLKSYDDKNTKSGAVVTRWFCSQCGSSMFVQPKAFKSLVILTTGPMQDKSQPAFELFGENKSPWIGEVAAKKARL